MIPVIQPFQIPLSHKVIQLKEQQKKKHMYIRINQSIKVREKRELLWYVIDIPQRESLRPKPKDDT
jgi:hypothetical protein